MLGVLGVLGVLRELHLLLVLILPSLGLLLLPGIWALWRCQMVLMSGLDLL